MPRSRRAVPQKGPPGAPGDAWLVGLSRLIKHDLLGYDAPLANLQFTPLGGLECHYANYPATVRAVADEPDAGV
jgi:hypothetical protein